MTACRGCGDERLTRVLDLGAAPPADHFPPATGGGDDVTYPLAMEVCDACGLAQLAEDATVAEEPRGVEPQALKDQAAAAVERVAAAGWLRGRTVREFGSPHGGSWTGLLAGRGFSVVSDGPADVVLDSFGIMHERDQASAFRRRAAVTAPGGVLLLQYHALETIVTQGQWNALRHGHFAYYSRPALRRLLASAGMTIETSWHFELYGGTELVAAVHATATPTPVAMGVSDDDTVVDRLKAGALQRAADGHTSKLAAWLADRHRDGTSVAAYGAASRAVALFSLAGVNRELVSAVADASPAKHGRRMPGTDIPVVSPAELIAMDPDLVLLTLPDLLDEVATRFPVLAGRFVDIDRLDARGYG
ncbi:class I SAM-dependent methyltransferase [Mycolicibacterium goodii]|uniref:Class I SAM-dependent methyltransferase n=1 Tax=Mycolicibacterium goodii TaxID=134601 RepID=A0ABS6HVJ0_MYCGD|nr:class I SAM-dependent methyltransferase [Mycolicibacterium goodii]MBU8808606.1 class I SAM-dependent methyltransferase [Mycolicibacterium goodii]MBU8819207.1 class I SAM-dependent methyltransferase [Mycolicibacterium goodii]MBU8826671.1 class I SAM-dependent methyltransferase [Mycolicibacterium goodii]MBU8833039.1 class I SAM-dependent methyltransferase [Mycolicibacterium goodii]MBU8837102.1 class I SAM-dependent methyltransferase [Mycolicibacterium goodii]